MYYNSVFIKSLEMDFEQLDKTNIFEDYINNENPSKKCAFSPRIHKVFNEVSANINNIPMYTLVYIGFDSFSHTVYFYKCSKNITYIFMIGIDGIKEYYLL